MMEDYEGAITPITPIKFENQESKLEKLAENMPLQTLKQLN